MGSNKSEGAQGTAPSRRGDADRKVATALWKAVGGFGFLSSLALMAGMASEKVGPEVLKLIDSNPYAVTLFGIPLLAGVLIGVAVIGRVYSRASKRGEHWSARIPPIVEGVSESSLRVPVNSSILIAFLVVPWFVLGVANVKFFRGTYYYASNASKGCDEKNMLGACEEMGYGWRHFVPKHGIGSLTSTPYRYEANKTYIPVLVPLLFVGLTGLGSAISLRFIASLFTDPRYRE